MHPSAAKPGVRRTILANASWMLLFQLSGVATPLLIYPYLIRTLGDESFGNVAFVYSTAIAFSMIVEYGFNFTAVRELARVRDDATRTNRIFYLTQHSKFLILGPALLAYLLACGLRGDLGIGFALAGAPLLVANALLPLWFHQARERLALPVTILIGGRLAALACLLLLVRNADDGALAISILTFGTMIPAWLLHHRASRAVGARQSRPTWHQLRSNLAAGRYLFVSNLCGTVLVHGPVILLGYLVSSAQLAPFAAIDKLCYMLRFSYLPLNKALFPYFSRRFGESPHHALKRLGQISAVVAAGLAAIGLLVHFNGETVLRIYLGRAEPQSLAVLSILILVPAVTFLRSAATTLGLIPLNEDRAQMRLQLVACAVFLVAFVPAVANWQSTGAAAAILLAEIAVTGVATVILYGVAQRRCR
ncbi:MAG: lipopolysaccharide biosynthesis protein [Rhodocyclaceae bacterium]|nr:lipopolysaccharide biosynthesis protein [Rhodocyclaceae bacterium]